MRDFSVNEAIESMALEGSSGSQELFYELYGSGISPALLPLSEILTLAQKTHPELVELFLHKFLHTFADDRVAELEESISDESDQAIDLVWNFRCDWGVHGFLEAVFLATEEEIEGVIGRTAYFGEVFGKHRDVRLRRDYFSVALSDPTAVMAFKNHVGSIGRCPLDFIEDEDYRG